MMTKNNDLSFTQNAPPSDKADALLEYDGPVFVEGYEDEKGDYEPSPRLERATAPTHPGEILRALYLPQIGLNLTQLAERLHVSRRTISMIINGSRPVTVDMAHRLSRALGTTPEFWLRLQSARDTWEAASLNHDEYERIERFERVA